MNHYKQWRNRFILHILALWVQKEKFVTLNQTADDVSSSLPNEWLQRKLVASISAGLTNLWLAAATKQKGMWEKNTNEYPGYFSWALLPSSLIYLHTDGTSLIQKSSNSRYSKIWRLAPAWYLKHKMPPLIASGL